MLSYLVGLVSQAFNYLFGNTDTVKIIKYQDRFLLGELTDRAQAEGGVANTSIGLPFLPSIYNFYVFTDVGCIEQIANYGQFYPERPENYDSKARSPFDPLKKLLGREFIIHMNGPDALEERRLISGLFSDRKAMEGSYRIFNESVNNWSNETSINDTISYACMRIIASEFLGIKILPPKEELIPLIKRAEYCIFNSQNLPASEFDKIIVRLKEANAKVLEQNKEHIFKDRNYLHHMVSTHRVEQLEEIAALTILIVEGNIGNLLSSTLTYLASNKELQNQLRAELNKLDKEALSSTDKCLQVLKSSKFLNNFFLECLRFFAPVAPIIRYVQNNTEINGTKVPKRSFIIAPLRRMLRDPNRFKNPDQFDLSRHQDPKNDPTFIFSRGSRSCPASHGFSKTVFLMAMKIFFMDNEITLTSHQVLEPLDLTSKEPLLEQQYFAQLRKIDSSASPKPITCQFDKEQGKAAAPNNAPWPAPEPQLPVLPLCMQGLGPN